MPTVDRPTPVVARRPETWNICTMRRPQKAAARMRKQNMNMDTESNKRRILRISDVKLHYHAMDAKSSLATHETMTWRAEVK